jgi:hypothetical protein
MAAGYRGLAHCGSLFRDVRNLWVGRALSLDVTNPVRFQDWPWHGVAIGFRDSGLLFQTMIE